MWYFLMLDVHSNSNCNLETTVGSELMKILRLELLLSFIIYFDLITLLTSGLKQKLKA